MAKLPNFLIVGAAKCGTTTLHAYLERHPQIFMCRPKEPEFFARDDIYSRGWQWYKNLFSDAGPHQLCGEASTIYSLWPHFPNTVSRLAERLPDIKIIYIMRHPVDRAYSFYVQLTKNFQNATGESRVVRSFEECVFPERFPSRSPTEEFLAPFDRHYPDIPGIFLDGSDYFKQLSLYRSAFSDGQILILYLEDIARDPMHELKVVWDFLGVDPDQNILHLLKLRENTSESHFAKIGRRALAARLKEFPPVNVASKLLPSSLKRPMRDFAANGMSWVVGDKAWMPSEMKCDTRIFLNAYFEKQNQKLSHLTQRDLSAWQV